MSLICIQYNEKQIITLVDVSVLMRLCVKRLKHTLIQGTFIHTGGIQLFVLVGIQKSWFILGFTNIMKMLEYLVNISGSVMLKLI